MKKIKTFLAMLAFLCLSINGALAQYIPVERIIYWISSENNTCYENSSDTLGYICMMLGDVGGFGAATDPWVVTNPGLLFESENPEIASLTIAGMGGDQLQLVHANSIGETKIFVRAVDPNYTDVLTIKVVVKDFKQGDLKTDPPTLTIIEGSQTYLQAYVQDPDDPGKKYYYSNVTWSSSDQTVVSIEESTSFIHAISFGDAVLTATTPTGVTATCQVHVDHKPPPTPNMPTLARISGSAATPYSGCDGPGLCVKVEVGTILKIIPNGEANALRYTLDGSDPTALYGWTQKSGSSEPITINKKTVIRAVAVNIDAFFTVFSQEMTYTIIPELKQPFVINQSNNAPGANWEYGQKIEIKESSLIAGAQIRYTLDGSEPSSTSKLYTGPITLNETVTKWLSGYVAYGINIRARVFCNGFIESPISFDIRRVDVSTPEIDPLTGVITCATPGAKIYYGLYSSYDWGMNPNESSTLYTGPVSNAGITEYKRLTAVAYKNNLNKSKYGSCSFYGDAPTPKVAMWNYYTHDYRVCDYYKSDLSNYTVAPQDSFKLVTPGYPTAVIRYTDNGNNVTPDNGYIWDLDHTGLGYEIYKNTTIKAKSYLPPRPESEQATFNFTIMDKPERPTATVKDIVVAPGTELCFRCSSPVDGFVFTTDGTIPYITWDPITTYIIYTYRHGGKLVSRDGCIWRSQWYAPYNKLTIDNTCTFNVIAYAHTPDGGVVMSDMASFTYRVATQNVETEIDKGELGMHLTGDDDVTLGLTGKLLQLTLKHFHAKSDKQPSEQGEKSYLAICKNLTCAEDDPAKRAAFETINTAFYEDFQYVNKDLIKTVIEPYKFSESSGGFGFEFEAGGILMTQPEGIVGGLYLSGKAHGEGKGSHQLSIFNLSYRVGFWAELTAIQKLALLEVIPATSKDPVTHRTESKTKLQLDLGINARVSFGIPFLASVSLDGEARLYLDWIINENRKDLWLHGKMSITGKLLGASATATLLEGKHTFSSYKSDSPTLRFPDVTNSVEWKVLPRKYLEKKSVWVGDKPSVRSGAGMRVLQESVYSETDPKLAEGGGKRVMVFLADDPTRDDYNRSILMFSIYNSTSDTWSTPVAVNNNGRADFYPSIACSGNNIWVAWQNSKTLFTASSTVEDIVAAGEICAAKFNNGTNKFDAPTMLTSNTYMDASPKIAVLPTGGVCVTWLRNQSNDISGANHLNKIMESYSNGTTWQSAQEVKTGLGPIYDLDVAWFNSNIRFAYITDGANPEENEFNLEITELDGPSTQPIVANQTLLGLHFTSLNGVKVLSWLENDRLRYMTEGGAIQNLTDSADMLITQYKILSNGTKTAVVYPALQKSVGVLYARNYESGKLGVPYKLAITGGLADKFDGLLENNHDFFIAYNNSVRVIVGDGIEETNDLVTLKCPAPVNLRLTGLHYAQEDVKLGQPLPVYMDIENIGGVYVDEVEVFVNNEIATMFNLDLNTGDKKTQKFLLDVPSNMAPLTNFVISIKPEDIDMNDNFLSATLGYTNFTMDLTTKYHDDNTVTVTADITNNSDYAADTKLLAHLGAKDGPVIDYFDFGNFGARANKIKTFNYNVEDLCPAGQQIFLYYEIVSNRDAEYKCSSSVILHNDNGTIPDSVLLSIKPYEKPTTTNSVLVYPNPTTGEVKIQCKELKISNVDVFDMYGKMQSIEGSRHNGEGQMVINISHLSTGVYFLKINTEFGVVVKKVVKTK